MLSSVESVQCVGFMWVVQDLDSSSEWKAVTMSREHLGHICGDHVLAVTTKPRMCTW